MGCTSSKTQEEENDERMRRLVGNGYTYMPPGHPALGDSDVSSLDIVDESSTYPNRLVPPIQAQPPGDYLFTDTKPHSSKASS